MTKRQERNKAASRNEVKNLAKEIYELCLDKGLTYADYRKVVLELIKIRESIAHINFKENGKKPLRPLSASKTNGDAQKEANTSGVVEESQSQRCSHQKPFEFREGELIEFDCR